jgi:hypothetical protein
VNLDNEYTREIELENENKILKEKYVQDMNIIRLEMKQEMKKQIAQLMTILKPEIVKEGLS